MLDGTLPGGWGNNSASFFAANSTRAKILVDTSPPRVAPAISGVPGADETVLPGEIAIRQRIFTGGRRVSDGLITSSDAVEKGLLVFQGLLLSAVTAIHALFGGMGTVGTTATTNATITRSTGSFITDGWLPGDTGMVFGSIAASAANDGSLFRVTTVAALTLTLDGVSGISVAGTESAGYRIFRVGQCTRKSVTPNAGNSNTIPAVPLIGGAQDPRIDTGILLDANGCLIVGMAAAVSALPAVVSASANWGDY